MTNSPAASSQAPLGPAGGGETTGLSSARESNEDLAERKVYEAMAGAIVSSLDEFLQTFRSEPDSEHAFRSLAREEFFPTFFNKANKMVDDCCQKLVKIIRVSSRIPSVREAPTPDLAKRVRETAFKPLDGILAGYYGTAKKIGVIYGNIKKIRDALAKEPSPGEPAKAAGPAGGTEAAAAGTEAWATDAELGRQHENLLRAQTQAFARIVQYLRALNDLPGPLMDYASDKCFAGEVNFQLELAQVSGIKVEMHLKLAAALEVFERAGALARQEVEQERASILANIELEKHHQALEKVWSQKVDAKLKSDQRFKKLATVAFFSLLLIAVAIFWFLVTRG